MKTLSIFIALACMSLAGYSQNNNNGIEPPKPIDQSKFSIGFKGGYGHSFITPYQKPMFFHSWDAGISAVYAPWQHWGIEADAIYSEEGAKFKHRASSEDHEQTRVVFLDYIRVPVKAVYFFNTYENDFRPKVTLGPTVGFLIDETNSRNASAVDFGATATLGFNYRLAKAVWLNVDADYYQGLVDVYPGSDNNMMGNLRLNMGVNFGF